MVDLTRRIVGYDAVPKIQKGVCLRTLSGKARKDFDLRELSNQRRKDVALTDPLLSDGIGTSGAILTPRFGGSWANVEKLTCNFCRPEQSHICKIGRFE